MNVFVTGGTGVLGVPVLRMLGERGHRAVALAHRAASAERLRSAGIDVVEGELFDAASLARATRGIDAILHLATRIPPAAEMPNQSAWDDNNRIRSEGTRTLVDVALANGVSVFVYPGVTFVYPDSGDRWIDALTTTIEPAETLRSTLDAEAQTERFAQAGQRGVILRLGLLYGPTSGHTLETLHNAQQGIIIPMGADDAFQSSIWADDAARAIVAAMELAPSGTYDVVDDEPLRQRELIKAMTTAVGRTALPEAPAGGSTVVPVTALSRRVSNERFKRVTGWQPTVASARDGWLALTQSIK